MDIVKRGRGRPRKDQSIAPTVTYGSNGANAQEKEVAPLHPSKIGKFLGFCPNCFAALSTLDSIEGVSEVYTCYSCQKDIKQHSLLAAKPTTTEAKYKSKKEYLEDCLNTADHAFVPISSPDVISKEDLGDLIVHTEKVEKTDE